MPSSKTLSQLTSKKASVDFDSIANNASQTHLLQNQQMTSAISTTGAGGLYFGEMAITRRQLDPTADASGYFIYLRDLDSGKYWSTSYQPTLQIPIEGYVRRQEQSLEFSRIDDEIHSAMTICLAAEQNIELRNCKLTNLSSKPRRIELTSYLELVLQQPQADAAHPAFSKLFIETEIHNSCLLVARRRKREATEETVAAAHFLVDTNQCLPSEFETDRCRFIGRGQDLSNPLAMQSRNPLTGTLGSVLDPILSLRKTIFLAPNESAFVTFGVAASSDEPELTRIAAQCTNTQFIQQTFQAASNSPNEPTIATAGNTRWRADISSHLSPDNHAPFATANALNRNRNQEKIHSPSTFHQAKQDRTANANALVIQQEQTATEKLLFDNGWGGFSADGKEYVIRVGKKNGQATNRPPMPWVNIIANPNLGFIVSESGAGYTWAGNSRLNRLTRWHNDPVCDPPSEALYIRDDEKQVFWSPTPSPVPQDEQYEIRHGFGYTKFLHTSHQIKQEVTQFAPREDAIKITCVRLKNQSNKTRQLSLFSYHQWELSDGDQQNTQHTQTTIHPNHQAIYATNEHRGVFSNQVAFASLFPGQNAGQVHFSGDRLEFLGQNGKLSNPQALQTDATLSGSTGMGLDPCAACQATVEIPPGETLEYIVLLGEADSLNQAKDLLNRYQTPAACSLALTEVQEFWREKLSRVQIETPSPAIDLLVNGWLPYQNLSCRIWGRSSTYQSGGAYGFRDQLQDAAAWMHQWPELTREQIVRNASHQFVEGDVLHWWHPPASRGIRTIFSDDLLWLPLFAAEYVAATGDETLWQENARFLSSEPVPTGEAERMVSPEIAKPAGTIYEHCCRALDRGLTTGKHGLPVMGCGDWNDGMNRVGQAGTGESIWLGFFIDYILERMLPVCQQHKDQVRFTRYTKYREQLSNALNDAGWDGKWYRRAYFDDGTPLGTATADECQIDALAQAWAVLSTAAPPDRAEQAMAQAERQLVDEQAKLIKLLAPPFDQMPQDPGYIKGYLPGIRENGGQYTHGVLWFIRAIAELGKGTRAVELLEMLSPINHGRNATEVQTYQVEPYVVAADVYSQPPHEGRGGWSWYTGSAGWMWRVAVESILGIQMKAGKTLVIDPKISADWPKCQIEYKLPDGRTSYTISIENPDKKQSGVSSAQLDGQELLVQKQIAKIPLQSDGEHHHVQIKL